MYCQKCRSPLKLDGSLEELNPAAFDLLVGTTGRSQRGSNTSLWSNYPQERKDLYDRVSKHATAPIYKRTIPPPQDDTDTLPPSVSVFGPGGGRMGNPDMSFIEITESQIVVPDKDAMKSRKGDATDDASGPAKNGQGQTTSSRLSSQLTKGERLFSILSSHSDIDHPICAECTSLLLASFNARLASATQERDAYASFLKSLQQSASSAPGPEDEARAQKELATLLKEEEAAYEELQKLEKEKQELEAELTDLEEESRQLQMEEQEFWAQRNYYDDELHELSTHLASLQQRYAHDQQQLERLQRTNVYNDTFCIGHDGYFGTINGLRLGRLPNQNVEWAEINAAWGQTLLLLATVAERLGYTFQGYRLKPLGSTSRIEKLEWPQQSPGAARANTTARLHVTSANPPPKVTPLDLFSSGDIPLERVFHHRRFDAGMVAFLDCLAQLGDHVERTSGATAETRPTHIRSPSTRNVPSKRVLPYSIQGDKIGDVSIKLGAGFQQDENFTKACKYALTCCKFLLAHVSNLESQKDA